MQEPKPNPLRHGTGSGYRKVRAEQGENQVAKKSPAERRKEGNIAKPVLGCYFHMASPNIKNLFKLTSRPLHTNHGLHARIILGHPHEEKGRHLLLAHLPETNLAVKFLEVSVG